MGRGENNLLYNPPVMLARKKPFLKDGRQEYSRFSKTAWDLILTPRFNAFRDMKGDIYLLDEDMQFDRSQHPIQIDKYTPVAFSKDLTAWVDHNESVVTHFKDQDTQEAIYKVGLKGKVLGIHLGKEHLYALWLDPQQRNKAKLSKISFKKDTWIDLDQYKANDPLEENVFFKNQGERSLVVYENKREKRYLLSTLTDSESGFLEIRKDRIPGSCPENLITATKKKNQYFAVSKDWSNRLHITVLKAKESKKETHLGEASVENIFPLDQLESSEFKDLAYSDGRGLLLADKELILFDEKKVIKIIPLNQDEIRFDRVAFLKDKAFLWHFRFSGFQEFRLPKKSLARNRGF